MGAGKHDLEKKVTVATENNSKKQINRKATIFSQMTKKVILSKEEMAAQEKNNKKQLQHLCNYSNMKTERYSALCRGNTKGPEYELYSVNENNESQEISSESKGHWPEIDLIENIAIANSKNNKHNRNGTRNYHMSSHSIIKEYKHREQPKQKYCSKNYKNKKATKEENKTISYKGRINEVKADNSIEDEEVPDFDSNFDYDVNDLYHKSVAVLQKASEIALPRFDKISSLPSEVFMEIISFAIDNFRKVITVNPSWYYATTQALDIQFNAIENNFVNEYASCLLLKDSFTSSSITQFCGSSGIRIDRVIKCENLPVNLGKTIKIGYTYKYINEPLEEFNADFVFDSIEKGYNCIWIQKNECKVFYYFIKIALVSYGRHALGEYSASYSYLHRGQFGICSKPIFFAWPC